MEKKLYSLTNPQKSIYYTEEYYKGTNINNIAGTMTINGPVDFEKFILAIKQFIKQNDSCRTMLTNEKENIMQYINSYEDFDIEIVDVASKGELSSLANEIVAKPFSIYNSYLFKFVIFRFPNNHGGFIVNMHHLIADSWTLGIVVNEIIEIYSSYIKNEPYTSKDSSTYSYINYIEAENEYKSSGKYEKDKAYWNELFSTIPDSATIPSISTISNSNDSTNALREECFIPSDLLNQIKEYCMENKASIFNFLTAVFSLYVSRVSNLEDFCIGTPILNRSNFKEKNTTGMFVSTLPLRVSIDNTLSFSSFLSSIATNSMSLLRHQKYSYQSIIEDLRKRQNDLPALYNIMISYQITKMNEEQETIPHDSVWYFNKTIADDIDIHIFDLNDTNELNIAYDYKIDKYTSEDMKNIHNRILTIISQVLENKDIKLSDIEIVTDEEKHKLIYEFNNTKTDYPKNKTVTQLFEEQVKLTPDNVALVFEGTSLTYKELDEKANQLAYYLTHEKHIMPQTLIGIMTNRSFEMVIGLLAILKCGCCYIPIDPEYPIDRIHYMIENSNAAILLTDKKNFNVIKNITNVDISISSDIYQKNNNFVSIQNKVSSKDLMYVIYTSGSTGLPKGIMISNENVVNYLYALKQIVPINKYQNFVSVTTMCFDIFVTEIWGSLTNGLTLILASEKQQNIGSDLNELCNKYNADIIQTTPSRFKLLINSTDDLSFFEKISIVMVGGEPLPAELITFFKNYPNIQLYNMYGPTETTVWSSIKPLPSAEHITIGKPIGNTQIYILDSNHQLLPINTIGEIYIGGDGLAKGYLNNSELTAKSFISSPFMKDAILYKTGDLGYIQENGEIVHLGRLDSQTKINGFRVELKEIENVILSNPLIKEAVVTYTNNILAAFYISTSEITDIELNHYLNSKLPYYMVPKVFYRLEKMPLTPNGKIDKKALPKVSLSAIKREKMEPRNSLDTMLIEFLKTNFNIKDINILDSITELGADSLTAIKLSVFIQKELNVTVTVKDIFTNAVIKDLSDFISQKAKQSDLQEIVPIEKQEYYPVSSAQKRMYYASSLDDNSLLYNIAGGIILSQTLDKEKLEKCFNTIINRHESLRTYFEIVDGNIVQKILDKVDFKLEFENSDSNDIDKLFNSFVKPFNLNKAPLFNAKLININNKKSLLLINMHHIISDGTSLSILIDELCKLYNNEGNLPELTISYKDFAVWENNKLKSDQFNKDKEYWVNQFNDEIPLLNMPTNYARPSMQSFEGDNVFSQIDSNLTSKLNEVSKKLGITPYMLLLSVYYILLYKYTGQNDIVVGSPIVGRDNVQLSNIIGMFVNSLALRNKIDSSISFKDFANEIKNNCLSAFEHQTYPFDELVNSLEIKRDTSRNPLFDTMFIYQNNGNVSTNFDGIKSEVYIPKTNISKFDLSLEIMPENDELTLRFEYCTRLFNKDFIDKLAKHYLNILQTVISENDVKIANIDILSKEEKEQILDDFNNTKVDYPKDKTVIQLFEEQVEKNPNGIAVIFEEQKLTYKELNEKANQLAHCLVENGVKHNDIVGIMLERSFETIISMLAVLKANSAYMLIDVNLPEDRILYMLNNANSTLLITASTIKNINFDSKLFVDKVTFDTYNKNNLKLNYNIKDNLSIVYTSGSTGNPKGVLLMQQGMVNLIFCYKKFINIDNFKNFLSICSISFDMFAVEIFIPLLNNKTLIFSNEEEHKDPIAISKLINDNDVEFMLITPSKIQLLLANNSTSNCLKKLKSIQLGGEVFTANLFETLKKYTNAQICNEYGPSEITSCCSYKEITSTDNINIGGPIDNVQIYILNQDMNLCPIGVDGEICVSGDGISKGYINNATATNKVFIKNPFGEGLLYKTGDIGKYNSNGEIEYIGRKDFQVKLRGLRIELPEIEKQLLNIENIKNCAVIYKEQPNNNSYLAAFFTSEKDIDIAFIRTELSKHLPLYMVPKYIIKLDNMPITRNGKIDLKALKEYKIENIETSNYVAPENEMQKLFCDTWEKLLNTKVGITDDIFELGADSLLAIKFKVELLSHNVSVEYADIFKYPTVKELSEVNSITNTEQIDSYDYTEINKILEKNNIKNAKNVVTNKSNNVLLLGSNGFVGMHILYQFIKKDNGKIYCIVRDKNKLSARTRFLDALHFYFNNELDEFIDNRIIILKGDITKENFGLNTELYNDIVNNVSIVINSSANVKHYGNFKNFENINIGLTKKAIEFCENYNKRLIQISTTSVSGEINKNEHITFSENNLYIGQNLDNVYVKSKFKAERIILEHIAKGLKAQILRLGNITNRYSDGKFQINANENAFIGRIQAFISLGIIPEYLLNAKLEFTPVDLCGLAVVSIIQNYIPDFSVFHLYNNEFITMQDFIDILKKYNINLKVVNSVEFQKIIKAALLDDNKKDILSGIINELDSNNNFEINSNIDILSEFSRSFLYAIDFKWLKIDNVYIEKYIKYFKNIKFI